MNSAPVSFALVLLLVGVVLAAGCSGQPAHGNTTAKGTATVNPSAMITQPVQMQCHPSGNNSPFILIFPIGTHYAGDIFEINGTTNIGVDETLFYSVSKAGIATPMPVPSPENPAYQYNNGAENISYGDILIVNDKCDEQKWSFWLNTSGSEYYKSYGVPFILIVKSRNIPIYNSTSFFLRNKE
jgi:hypothetical protein